MKDLKQCSSQQWDVVVIGGGCTGAGVLRDLSMRGFKTLLLEQRDFAHGTSSRFHGLLHSGARYAVSDPEAGRECIEENAILRRIGAYSVELTEGLFVRSPEDDPQFEPRWVEACTACGIAVTPITVAEARAMEPNLAPDIVSAYRVPDAGVDGFRLVWQNALSARRHGGEFLTYTEITAVRSQNGRVCGVEARDVLSGETAFIPCSFVVNAAGSWVARIAACAGLDIHVQPDRGALVGFNHRFTDRVVNRLRKASDGDIFVPHGSITILGTTSCKTDDPDDTRPTTEEVRRLLDIGRVLFPRIDEFRILRAFAGTRPLFVEDPSAAGRGASRGFKVIDHEAEGLTGMISVCGGKLTTYRLMAEKTVDLVCTKLGSERSCRTADEQLVAPVSQALRERAAKFFPAQGLDLAISRLGERFEDAVNRVEGAPWKKVLVCECELVTLAEYEQIASEPTSHSLGDIRRRTRMGMGTCQGSFCGGRGVGSVIEAGLNKGRSAAELLRDFQQERWAGFRPVIWGNAAREIELSRGIYAATLNIDGAETACPSAACAEPPTASGTACPANAGAICQQASGAVAGHAKENVCSMGPSSASRSIFPRGGAFPCSPSGEPAYDVLVTGGGFAGLMAAVFSAQSGRRTALLTRGTGALSVGGGTIDVLGYPPDGSVLDSPFDGLGLLGPRHPYSLVGMSTLESALTAFQNVCEAEGYPYVSTGRRNSCLITAIGTTKPVFLAPASMNMHGVDAASELVLVGFEGLKDFHPRLAAEGLAKHAAFRGRRITPVILASPFPEDVVPGAHHRDLSTLDLARFLDAPEGRAWLVDRLRRAIALRSGLAVVLPPVLGTQPDVHVHAAVQTALGVPVVEAVAAPPAVTGLRLRTLLLRRFRKLGGDLFEQAEVTQARVAGGRCTALTTRICGREREYTAQSFIMATGGIYGGGLDVGQHGCRETVFGLDSDAAPGLSPGSPEWSSPDAFGGRRHPFASVGIAVNADLHPVDAEGRVLIENVCFVGRSLGGYDGAVEKSGNGVALSTAWWAAGLR